MNYIMIIIGGVGSILGSFLGAAFIVLLPVFLMLLIATVGVSAMVFFPMRWAALELRGKESEMGQGGGRHAVAVPFDHVPRIAAPGRRPTRHPAEHEPDRLEREDEPGQHEVAHGVAGQVAVGEAVLHGVGQRTGLRPRYRWVITEQVEQVSHGVS